MCGKTLPVSGGVYLPAFWATPLIIVLSAFWATPHIIVLSAFWATLVLYQCKKGVWPKKQVRILIFFFPWRNINLGGQILLMTIFETNYLLELSPIFDVLMAPCTMLARDTYIEYTD